VQFVYELHKVYTLSLFGLYQVLYSCSENLKSIETKMPDIYGRTHWES